MTRYASSAAKRPSNRRSVVGCCGRGVRSFVRNWCPGRESYATTDTTNRCLSLVWWREPLARWRGGGSPVLFLAGSLASTLGSIFMASRKPRLVRTLARFESRTRNTFGQRARGQRLMDESANQGRPRAAQVVAKCSGAASISVKTDSAVPGFRS